MENMSPLLRTKLEQLNNNDVQNNTQNNNQPKPDLSTKPDTVELSNKKPKEHKALKIIAVATAVLAVVAGGFALAKKGVFGEKLQKGAQNLWSNITKIFKKQPAEIQNSASTEGEKPLQGIKKFFTNGEAVEGVKLEKGKAIASDGSGFTGTMETVTKSGRKVELSYKDGNISESKIDDKLFKTYHQRGENEVIINQFGQTGIEKQNIHFHNENGKLSKILKRELPKDEAGELIASNIVPQDFNVLEFSNNGKMIADYKTDMYYTPKEGKIFREDGTLEREFKATDSDGFIETAHQADGTKLVKKSGEYHLETLDEQLASKKMEHPSSVAHYDKDGNLTDICSTKQSDNKAILSINTGDKTKETEMVIPYAQELSPNGEERGRRVYVKREIDGDDNQIQSLSIYQDRIVNHKTRDGFSRSGFTKEQLASSIEELERGVKIAEDNGMLYTVNRDGCEVSYDRFKGYIEQLKSYMSQMEQ